MTLNSSFDQPNSSLKSRLISLRDDVDRLISRNQAFGLTPSSWVSVVFFDIGDTLVVNEGAGFQWVPEARHTVETLRLEGFQLGIISNTGSLTRSELIAELPNGLLDHFDDNLIILSSETGIEKPHLGIFYEALSRVDAAASRAFFISENLMETFAAQKAGMLSVRVKSFDQDFPWLESILR